MISNQTVTADGDAPEAGRPASLPTIQPKDDPHTADARWQRTAIAAFYRAEARGFAPGGELEDWLAAERELNAADALREPERGAPDAPETPSARDSGKRKVAARKRAATTKGGKSTRGATGDARNRGDES